MPSDGGAPSVGGCQSNSLSSERSLMSGQLVYFEMPAQDPQRAAAFYNRLLNWSTAPRGNGTYQSVTGAEVQGGITRSDSTVPTVYFSVPDLDAALSQVSDL